MTSFRKSVISPYGTKTYEEVKKTHKWIMMAINKLSDKPEKIEEHFLFHVGKMLCSTDSISEFTENAYEASEFEMVSFSFTVFYSDEFIVINYLSDISVCTQRKETLEKIISMLESTSIEDETEPNVTNITYKNSVVVQGSKNIIANNKSKIITGEKESKPKFKQWLIAIGQNLLANWIWYLLCLGVGALMTWLVTK